MKKLLEGLSTPEFDSGSEAVNYTALGVWAEFVKILATMEKEFRGDKEENQNSQVFSAILTGIKTECERRLAGSDDIPSTEEPDEEQEETKEPDVNLDAEFEDPDKGTSISDNTDTEDKSQVADSLIMKGKLTESFNSTLSEADIMRKLAGLPPRR